MTALSSKQRQFLKGLAHPLQPIVAVGKGGLSPALLQSLEQALDDHELIKLKFHDFKEQKKELLEQMTTQVGGVLVGVIGHVAILYRQQAIPEKRRILLPA